MNRFKDHLIDREEDKMLTFGPESPHKSPNARCGIGGFAILRCGLSSAALSLTALLMMCSMTDGVAQAADEHDFQICKGYFALCAASVCQPTGRKITVNVSGDGTAPFDEADCTCPVFSGRGIADVVGGNMQGSCTPPSSEQIWSIYSVRDEIPQDITGWVPTGPQASAPPLFCSKNLNLGNQLVNCFSFACDSLRYINGVPVATCHCPIGESLEGKPVPANTAFVSQAGQGDKAFCAKHPVSGPISFPSGMPALAASGSSDKDLCSGDESVHEAPSLTAFCRGVNSVGLPKQAPNHPRSQSAIESTWSSRIQIGITGR
jgi:hypothetical protein